VQPIESEPWNELTKKGVVWDLNSKNTLGDTPVHRAAACGNLTGLKILLEGGANAELKRKNGNTVLHSAAIFGNSDCVEFLIAHGVEHSVKNNKGNTAMHVAAQNNSIKCLEVLLSVDNGLIKVRNSSNLTNDTPLHFACNLNAKDCAAALVRAGVEWGVKNNDGRSALDLAIDFGHNATVNAMCCAAHEIGLIDDVHGEEKGGEEDGAEDGGVSADKAGVEDGGGSADKAGVEDGVSGLSKKRPRT
jgi:ankyrin repeat protein